MRTIRSGPLARGCGLLVVMLFALLPVGVTARCGQTEGFLYSVTTNAVEILRCDASLTGRVVVPSLIQGLAVRSIAESGLTNGRRVTEFVLPGTLRSIGRWAFARDSVLKTVRIPDGVTNLAQLTFWDCWALTNVEMGEGLRNIGPGAFQGCSELRTVRFGSGLESIGTNAFYNCSKLQEIRLGPNVVSIGAYAFQWCSSATNLVIGDGVKGFGTSAFANMRRLVTVSLGAGLESVDGLSFGDWTNLTRVDVAVGNPNYSSLNGVLYTKDGRGLLFYPRGRSGGFEMPDSVAKFTDGVFRLCPGLTSITLGAGITALGANEFSNCTNLASVVVRGRMTSLGQGVFSGCSRLTAVYFEGDAPTTVAQDVFGRTVDLIVYRRAAASGWGPSLAGRPVVIWGDGPVFSYADWAAASGLTARFPLASRPGSDPDGDGMSNLAEMIAGTDPTIAGSVLRFETQARPQDLAEEDMGPLDQDSVALYFSSVPGRSYRLLRATTPADGVWGDSGTVLTATAKQKRIVIRPRGVGGGPAGFFRLVVDP